MNPKSLLRSKAKDPRVSLIESVLTDLQASRGDTAATRSAFIRFFQAGLKANIAMRELMDFIPRIFIKAKYSQPEALAAMAIVKKLTPQEIQSER
jgi:hypothetical protein